MERIRDRIICKVMLFFLLVYYSQGILYAKGAVFSQISYVIFISFSFVFFVKVMLSSLRFSLFIKAWTVLLFINIIGFILKGDYLNYRNIQNILLNLLPFYAFYYFSKKGIFTRKHLQIILIFLLPMFIYKFMTTNLALQLLKHRQNVVDNTIYHFLGLIPLAFIFKRKYVSLAILFIIWAYIVQSAKRAAIISGSFGILLFFYYQFRTVNKVFWLFHYLFIVGVIFALSYFGYQYLMANDYILVRLNAMIEGDSAGRDKLSEVVFAHWLESSNPLTHLFGSGFEISGDITDNVSHNDWLELLASFGLLGFTIYLTLFYSAAKEIMFGKWIFQKKIIFTCIIGIALITSMTSRWYGSSFPYSQMLLLPYLLATKNKRL